MHARTDDPTYRRALEATVLPLPAPSSRLLSRDAELFSSEEGAATVSPSPLRPAPTLQLAVRQAIESAPDWSRERLLAKRRCAQVHGAEHPAI